MGAADHSETDNKTEMENNKTTTPKEEKPVKCPYCSAEWNNTEISQQECFSCGYPHPWDADTNEYSAQFKPPTKQ